MFMKSQCTYQVVLSICSLACILLISAKKCEFFSIWTPLFIFVSSFSLFILTTIAILWVRPLGLPDEAAIDLQYVFGVVAAEQHLMFTLQYLRSSLTVPLYFDRREKIESRRFDRVEEIEKRSKGINCMIVSA